MQAAVRLIGALGLIIFAVFACGKETVEPTPTGPQIGNLPPALSVVPPGHDIRHQFTLLNADSTRSYLWQVIATHMAPVGRFGIDTAGGFCFESEVSDSGRLLDFRVLIIEDGEIQTHHDFSVVVSQAGPIVLRLATRVHTALQGLPVDVSLIMVSGASKLDGFDILIAYDSTVLTPIWVTKGEGLGYGVCSWEYFTYRVSVSRPNPLRTSTIQISAYADVDNGLAIDPNCSRLRDGAELARLRFQVSNRRSLECTKTPLEFLWLGCSDNSAVVQFDGSDSVLVGSRALRPEWDGSFPLDSFLITSADCDSLTLASLAGYCGESWTACASLRPVDSLILWNGEVKIVCPDSIDSRP